MKKNKVEHYSEKEALEFHNSNKSGKIEIISSKPMTSKRDLALAYSPGVAAPVKAIAENPDRAYDYTTKGNLVAVISNGSAILGLGNLGSLASKPVMEGKSVLFKRFADIDSIDIEIDNNGSVIIAGGASEYLFPIGSGNDEYSGLGLDPFILKYPVDLENLKPYPESNTEWTKNLATGYYNETISDLVINEDN